MFRHILVGLDGSAPAQQALSTALELAAQSGAEVTTLSVEERLPAYAASMGEVQETKAEMDAYFQKLQAAAMQQAAARGVRFHTMIAAGHVADTLIRYAREGGFDLVLLGGARRGIGGTADRVAEQAPCSVLIVRATPLAMRVEDIMRRNVATVPPDAPLRQVVEILIARGVKAVPVVDAAQHVIGIITGGDLIERGGLRQRLSLLQTLDAAAIATQLHKVMANGKTARDVMTADPLVISERTPVSTAARLMAERRFKRLPVVNEQNQLIGIIARLDVLRVLAHITSVGQVAPTAPPPLGAKLVREVMTTTVPTASAEAPASEVAARLVGSPQRRVVVVDGTRRVLGLITDRELLQQLGPEAHASLLERLMGHTAPAQELTMTGRAGEMMIRNVITIADDAPISSALQRMIDKKVKRLPVVNSDNKLVGLLDRDAVLRAIAGEL